MEFFIPLENFQPNHCQEKICLSYIKIARLFSPGKAVTCWPLIFPFSLFYWHKQPQRSITTVFCHHTPTPGVRVLQFFTQWFGFLPGLCRSGLIPVLSPRCIRDICVTKLVWDTLYGTAQPPSWCGFVGDELRTPPQGHVPPRGWEQLSPLELVQTFLCALGTWPCQKQPLLPAYGPVSDHISWEQAMGQGAAVSQVGRAGAPPCLWEKFELTQENFTSSGRMELRQRNVRSGKHQEFFQTSWALLPLNAFGVLPLGCRRGGEHSEQMAGLAKHRPCSLLLHRRSSC